MNNVTVFNANELIKQLLEKLPPIQVRRSFFHYVRFCIFHIF